MISTVEIDSRKLQHLQTLSEGHFVDFKSKRIAPNKLTRTISAMANADGGEIYVGIEDPSNGWVWDGFFQPEDANGHISAFENIFLLGYGLNYTFIFSDQENGFVLHVEVAKSEKIVKSSDGEIYLRRSASNIPVKTEEQKHRLELDKGIYSFEDDRIKIDKEDIDNSLVTNKFMVTQIPTSEPESWFRKQKILFDNNMASVAGVMLFTDEPQVYLPKTAVKIYRYLTSDDEGSRENLETDPISVDGDVYEIIQKSVKFVREKIESISIVGKPRFRESGVSYNCFA